MYYDIEVRLTQGWFAVARDMYDWHAAVAIMRSVQVYGHTARLVKHHIATV